MTERSAAARTYAALVLRNVFSPINIVIGVLAVLLTLMGQAADAFFLAATMSLNVAVAIVQEVRARLALDKLELLTAQTARLLTMRKGVIEVPVERLEVGNHIIIESGDQIPGDGVVVKTWHCLIDEALLTGESLPVVRDEGETVFAGSIVVGGKAEVRLTATGGSTRVSQITNKLKWFDSRQTPIQQTLTIMMRWLTGVAFLIAFLMIVQGVLTHVDAATVVRNIAAGAISMVPEGLLLSTTLLFSYGVLRMAREGVLIKRLATIEGFGRLQYLCMDKTGTITEEKLAVREIVAEGDADEVYAALSAIAQVEPSPSSTLQAIMQTLPKIKQQVRGSVPFNPIQKWSAAELERGGAWKWVRLGAPEYLYPDIENVEVRDKVRRKITPLVNRGLRLVLVTLHSSYDPRSGFSKDGVVLGWAVLASTYRRGIEDALFYLQAQGVQIKVISGDAPGTVKSIAKDVGIRGTNNVLTGDQLAEMDAEEWRREVFKTTVFARIVPEQKERIIATFQKHGFTGMVGDGVNDALALKKADVGIAMLQGSRATRQVADMVLLDNSFSSFPKGMRIGSQIIIALEMVASVFFNRIAVNFTIIVLGLLAGISYPFLPRHLVMITFFTVGIPTFMWSLFPPEAALSITPERFFQRTLRFAIPNGFLGGLAVLSAYTMVRWQTMRGGEVDTGAVQTAIVMVVTALGMITFRTIPMALNAIDSPSLRRLQWAYYIGSTIFLALLANQGWFVEFFLLSELTRPEVLSAILIIILAGGAQIRWAQNVRTWNARVKRPHHLGIQ